jgi:hypothetical protein
VGSDHHVHPVFRFDEIAKREEVRARRISNHQAGSEVDHLSSILLHLGGRVFYIPAGASTAGRVPDKFNFLLFVHAECALAVSERSETFSTCARAVTVADNDPDLDWAFHVVTLLYLLSIYWNSYWSEFLQIRRRQTCREDHRRF